MEFHETQIGHIFFTRQIPELIESLNALTAAVSQPMPSVLPPIQADADFLSELYHGSYEPEVFRRPSQIRPLDQAVRDASSELRKAMPVETWELFEKYEASLTERSSTDMERAYEDGFRAAVQLIVAGLSLPHSSQVATTNETAQEVQHDQ